jgi:aminoglycoside phosphotransferase (APT) family kinase protein
MPEVGALIAKGRAADVYAYGEDHVLRRYRSDHDNLYEAAVMQHVASHGYPVPEVVEVSGRDMVMERLDGRTMLTDLQKHPWRIFSHARTCAQLIQRLHTIPLAPWLVTRHPDGEVIVHLDLHPDNVMLTSKGPVVIDWSNAGRGDGDTEVADLWLVLSSAEIPATGLDRLVAQAGRGLLVSQILRSFDRDALRARLPDAMANRSSDRNMSAKELARMDALIERQTR